MADRGALDELGGVSSWRSWADRASYRLVCSRAPHPAAPKDIQVVHILGQGSQQADEPHDHDGRRLYVTNFFSLGHLVPWGGTVAFRKIPPAELESFFKDKRVDLFVVPDLAVMSDLLRERAMATGQMPEGSEAEHEVAFMQMIEETIKQATKCHVKSVQKPKPMAVGKKSVFLQFYVQQSAVVGSTALGCIWWELTPKELGEKPSQVVTQ